VHPASLKFSGRPMLDMLSAFKRFARVPVFLHLDHCDERNEDCIDMVLEYHQQVLRAYSDQTKSVPSSKISSTPELSGWRDNNQLGCFDCIMVDGSAMTFDDNTRWTRAMTDRIHAYGISVEAELGRLAGDEVCRNGA
jgi:fructose/tagatose bisphosphate aldolase